jgi:hypothetical protein
MRNFITRIHLTAAAGMVVVVVGVVGVVAVVAGVEWGWCGEGGAWSSQGIKLTGNSI